MSLFTYFVSDSLANFLQNRLYHRPTKAGDEEIRRARIGDYSQNQAVLIQNGIVLGRAARTTDPRSQNAGGDNQGGQGAGGDLEDVAEEGHEEGEDVTTGGQGSGQDQIDQRDARRRRREASIGN